MKAVRHIGIVVSDLNKALAFYQDLLGLKVVKRMEESGEYIDKITALEKVKVTTVKMAAEDNNLIELLYYHSHPKTLIKSRPANALGVSHVAFGVEDIEAEYRRLKGKGILFNAPPQYSPDGYAKVTFCQDPDGNLIELVEVLAKDD